ncbi:hypothetical protein [Brachybacterium alimentarium]|uniref:hypothetical protein n=1 Tax=Brachybacterium alimentarium TaxID=47845 RepID=UPI0015F0420D
MKGQFETPWSDDRRETALRKPMLIAATGIAGLALMANAGVVAESSVTWRVLMSAAMMRAFGVVNPHP